MPRSVQANVYLGAGVIAYFVAVILGLTSLPSVEASLSWLEFRMIQSRLGWFCLILATVHVMANGWQKLLRFNDCIFLGCRWCSPAWTGGSPGSGLAWSTPASA